MHRRSHVIIVVVDIERVVGCDVSGDSTIVLVVVRIVAAHSRAQSDEIVRRRRSRRRCQIERQRRGYDGDRRQRE